MKQRKIMMVLAKLWAHAGTVDPVARDRGARRLAPFLALAALVVGCDQSPTAPVTTTQPVAPKPQVVASFYPLYEFARHVAGEAAEVIALVPPGVEPHDWEPSPRDVARVEAARLFVYNGGGFEPWADRLLANLGGRRPATVATTTGIELLDKDPHVWLDPVLAQAQVEAIRAGLVAADPPNGPRYAVGAKAFATQLAALHERFEQGLAACARREIVVPHAAFTYLARRYRLVQVPMAGQAPDAEPSPAELARIARLAKSRGVTVVFFEPLVASRLADTLAREIGARVLPLDPIEGLTREQAAAGKGYVALMEENLANLRAGLQCR